MGDEYTRAISTLPRYHAILVGMASSSTRPVLIALPDLSTQWRETAAPAATAAEDGGETLGADRAPVTPAETGDVDQAK